MAQNRRECFNRHNFSSHIEKDVMTKKEDEKNEAKAVSAKEEEENKLLEEHPYETMSQIQNRYGGGREQNGKEGSEKGANRLDH